MTKSEKPKTKQPKRKKPEIKGVLEALCRMLYGRRWQVELAEDLKISTRQVRRWQKDSSSVPMHVFYGLKRLAAERRAACDWVAAHLDDPLFSFKAKPSSIKAAEPPVVQPTSVVDRAASVARGRAYAEARMAEKAAPALKSAPVVPLAQGFEEGEVYVPEWLVEEHFDAAFLPVPEPEQVAAPQPLSEPVAAAKSLSDILSLDREPVPLLPGQRMEWGVKYTVSPESLAANEAVRAHSEWLQSLTVADVQVGDMLVIRHGGGKRDALVSSRRADGALMIQTKSRRNYSGNFSGPERPFNPATFDSVFRRPKSAA